MLISDTDTASYPHLLYKPSVWAASQMEAVLKGLLALTKNKVQELKQRMNYELSGHNGDYCEKWIKAAKRNYFSG